MRLNEGGTPSAPRTRGDCEWTPNARPPGGMVRHNWRCNLCMQWHSKHHDIARGAMLRRPELKRGGEPGLPSHPLMNLPPRALPRIRSQLFNVPIGILKSPMIPWYVPNPPGISTKGCLCRDVVRACAATSARGLKKGVPEVFATVFGRKDPLGGDKLE